MDAEIIVYDLKRCKRLYINNSQVVIIDDNANSVNSHDFLVRQEALRFVGEYISHVDRPTGEFKKLFPHLLD